MVGFSTVDHGSQVSHLGKKKSCDLIKGSYYGISVVLLFLFEVLADSRILEDHSEVMPIVFWTFSCV